MSNHSPIRVRCGLGWRPPLDVFAERARLGFIEIRAQSVDARRPPRGLDAARRRGVAIVPHAIGLSRLEQLSALALRVDAPLVSARIAAPTRAEQSLELLCERVGVAQARLPVALALECTPAITARPRDGLDDAAFVCELVARTGALLVVDLSGLYASAFNDGRDALGALRRLPLEHVAYVRVGGGEHSDGLYYDTRSDPVVPGVLALVAELYASADVPGVLLERDGDFPSEAELSAELSAITAAVARGSARRDPIPGDEPTRVARPRRLAAAAAGPG